MLGPSWGEKSVFVEEQKTAKNTANCGATHRSAAGAGSPIAKASGLRPGALPEYCWPDLSAYARQPARGPTMLAHLVARLAYVGLSCGQCGPSCGPMLRPMSADLEAYVGPCWPMLSQKIRKMGTAKNCCKTQDMLLVGGLSWGYVGPSWGYVGPSWRLCWPILGLWWPILELGWPILGLCWPILGLCWPILGLCWPILEAMLAHLGAMLAHLEAYVVPCWPTLSHRRRKMGKKGQSKIPCKT